MGQNIETEIAFSYLNDLKRKFFLSYELQNIKKSFSYQLKEFSEDIKKLTNSYEKNPESKMNQIKRNISLTREIMHENIERLLERNEKLNVIAQKSNRLMESSDDFIKNIQEIKRRQKIKKYKYIAIVVLLIILVAFIIYIIK